MNRLLIIAAAVISVVAAYLGTAHQTFARVDAGGPKLRMLITGSGSQTVVLEAGAGSPLESWIRIQRRVSKFARTVSYDQRAGNGLSEKSTDPRDAAHVAAELHAALHNAHLAPPYILVGHSLGGPYIRMFAAKYPGEVSGLVLVDPTQEELLAWAKEHNPDRHKSEHALRLDDEVDCAPQTFAELKDAGISNGTSVTLISGMGPREIPSFITPEMRREVEEDRTNLYPAKLRFHTDWIKRIPSGRLIVTENSGHGIPFEEPELVVKTIHEMIQAQK